MKTSWWLNAMVAEWLSGDERWTVEYLPSSADNCREEGEDGRANRGRSTSGVGEPRTSKIDTRTRERGPRLHGFDIQAGR